MSTTISKLEVHTPREHFSKELKSEVLELLARSATPHEVEKRYGISRKTAATWRRRASSATAPSMAPELSPRESPAPELLPEVVSPRVHVCTQCSAVTEPDDATILWHLVDCPKSDWMMRHSARKELKEMGCSTRPQSNTSTTSISAPETTPTPSSSLSSTVADMSSRKAAQNEPGSTGIDGLAVYAAELKTETWGDPEDELDMALDKFSPVTGEVIEGWSHSDWTLNVRMAGCRASGTQNTRHAFHG